MSINDTADKSIARATARAETIARLGAASAHLLADVVAKQNELNRRPTELFSLNLTADMGNLAQVAYLEVQPATGCLDIQIIIASSKVCEALLPFRRKGPTAPVHWRGPLAALKRELEALLSLLDAVQMAGTSTPRTGRPRGQ